MERLVVSTGTRYSLDDVLTTEEIQKLGTPDKTEQRPDAEVNEWGRDVAVATAGTSVAASMDRFKAGNLTPAQARTLEGFYSEFVDNGQRVVFVDDELHELLGDQAFARIDEFDQAYAVSVQSPEEAEDVIEWYDENYAGDVVDTFWQEVEANHAVMPVVYNQEGVIDEAGIALMSGDGILRSEDSQSPDQWLEEDVEGSVDTEGLEMERYLAPDQAEASFYLDVQLPPQYEDAGYRVENNSLVVEVDDQQILESFMRQPEILGEEENNGIYSFKIR